MILDVMESREVGKFMRYEILLSEPYSSLGRSPKTSRTAFVVDFSSCDGISD